MTCKFGIIGSGSWATALAKILTNNGHPICWWVRNEESIATIKKRHHNPHYLSSATLNTGLIRFESKIENLIPAANCLLFCIPSAYTMAAIAHLPKNIFDNKKIISAIKGVLPNDKHSLLNEYLQDEFAIQTNNYFSIMGPCHAEEIAAEKLSYLTFSGNDMEATRQFAACFKNDYLNTVINPDVWGTQYAAVLKNIYAVGAGIAHGLEYGDNFLSVYIANAADEMVGFLKKISENKMKHVAIKHSRAVAETIEILNYASSVYLGDLLVTCYSPFSRNRTFGNMIGKGYAVKVAQLEMNMVAEGYPASKGIYELNKTLGAFMPISHTIYQILWHGLEAATGFKQIETVLK